MLPTFPSRYWSTIGLPGVFSLAAWSPQIQTGFHVSRPTQVASLNINLTRTGLSPTAVRLSRTVPVRLMFPLDAPTTPHTPQGARFGLFPFRSPLLWESITFFLFLQVLRCFSSLRTLQDRSWRLAFNQTGSPIRTSPDQFLFADPRGFSQLTTSFFGSGSLGILRSLFFSFSS